MRRTIALLALALAAAPLPVATAVAAPPTFSPTQIVGSGKVSMTSVAVSPKGRTALVWRSDRGVAAAVRETPQASWQSTTLQQSGEFPTARDLQVLIARDGTATALWASTEPRGALLAATSRPGEPFGPARRVTRLVNAYSAAPRAIAFGDTILVVYSDRRGSRRMLFDARIAPDATRIRPLGIGGTSPVLAATGRGAVIAYLDAHLTCHRRPTYGCLPRSLWAITVDHAGGRAGSPVRVDGDAEHGIMASGAPRVASDGHGLAVVSWTRAYRGSGKPRLTRMLRISPLRTAGPARVFPATNDPGSGTPIVAFTRRGSLIGTAVGRATGDAYGGGAVAATATPSSPWSATQQLSGAAGWTTVPRLNVLAHGTLAVVTTEAPQDPTSSRLFFELDAAWMPDGASFLPSVTVGSPFFTNNATGVSTAATDADGLIAWPALDGGVGTVTISF